VYGWAWIAVIIVAVVLPIQVVAYRTTSARTAHRRYFVVGMVAYGGAAPAFIAGAVFRSAVVIDLAVGLVVLIGLRTIYFLGPFRKGSRAVGASGNRRPESPPARIPASTPLL
jgi:hypothetical protein